MQIVRPKVQSVLQIWMELSFRYDVSSFSLVGRRTSCLEVVVVCPDSSPYQNQNKSICSPSVPSPCQIGNKQKLNFNDL